ncbi:MAG: YraN family protein [Thermotogaceae bacterium]|nr:YraN family protein [Thermotogaceae bacterium]
MNWKEAEDTAADYLKRKGYTILQRNYRTRFGEIDIVARYKKYLVFVEVKSGKSYYQPRTRVNASKLRKISFAAAVYLSRDSYPYRGYRIDVIEVTEKGIEHLEAVSI